MLIKSLVERGDLALTEGVVKGVIDGGGRDSEASSRIAIDHDSGLQALGLLARVDVFEPGILFQPVHQQVRPIAQLFEVPGLQCVLELSAASSTTDAHVLNRLHDDGQTGDLSEFGAKTVDDE